MKYTILHINDRCKRYMDFNKNILNSFEYISDIEFFNGISNDPKNKLNEINIKTDTWKPYDGRTSEAYPGEYGIWISYINIWEYIVNNNIENLLVIEDDAIVENNFITNLNLCMSELPETYDFLSLHYHIDQNFINHHSDIGKNYIHKSINQFASTVGTIFSTNGAKKLLSLVKEKGIEYTVDCFMFRQSIEGLVNGYSIKPDTLTFLDHDGKNIKSIIDPENTRNV